MEYFLWSAWASCLAVLPPSSCTLAHSLNMGDWRKSLTSLIPVINILLILNPKPSSYWEEN